MPLDVFPEFAPPIVEIQTEVPGVSTEEVESLITVPIENALNGIPFVDTIRSKSVLGLSSVRLIFQPGTDLITARQLVQERLSLVAANLPTCCPSTDHPASAVIAKSGDEDRLTSDELIPDGPDGSLQMDNSPEVDVDRRCCERRNLGRVRPAIPSAREP